MVALWTSRGVPCTFVCLSCLCPGRRCPAPLSKGGLGGGPRGKTDSGHHQASAACPLSCWGTALPFPFLPKACRPGLSSPRCHYEAVEPGQGARCLRGRVRPAWGRLPLPPTAGGPSFLGLGCVVSVSGTQSRGQRRSSPDVSWDARGQAPVCKPKTSLGFTGRAGPTLHGEVGLDAKRRSRCATQ